MTADRRGGGGGRGHACIASIPSLKTYLTETPNHVLNMSKYTLFKLSGLKYTYLSVDGRVIPQVMQHCAIFQDVPKRDSLVIH